MTLRMRIFDGDGVRVCDTQPSPGARIKFTYEMPKLSVTIEFYESSSGLVEPYDAPSSEKARP